MPRRPDDWLTQTADPSGADLERALETWSATGGGAEAAERVAGRRRWGCARWSLRRVHATTFAPSRGRRSSASAMDGRAESPMLRVVHRVATVSLVWEQLEAECRSSRLDGVATAAGRVLAATDVAAPMTDAVAEHRRARDGDRVLARVATAGDRVARADRRALCAPGAGAPRVFPVCSCIRAAGRPPGRAVAGTGGGARGIRARRDRRRGWARGWPIVWARSSDRAMRRPSEIVAAHLTPLDAAEPGR